jgi:GNAT superfamily N-acetyltransferase
MEEVPKTQAALLNSITSGFHTQNRRGSVNVITFKYDVPLDQTMVFESIYPVPLQLELSEKKEIHDLTDSIFVWMFVHGELAGESYGIPLESCDEPIEGLTDLTDAEKKAAIYCYSNTILSPFQRQGYGAVLKAHWLGWAAAQGFSIVYGHARPGGSQRLNAKFGAVFVGDFPNWYGTDEEYKMYRLILR